MVKDILSLSQGMRVRATYVDPSTDIHSGGNAESIFEQLEAAGLPLEKSVNDRELFALAIHSGLNQEIEPGVPKWQIYQPGCPYLSRTLPLMRADKANPEAMGDHKEDHGAVAAAYFLMSHLPTHREEVAVELPQWMRHVNKRTVLGAANVARRPVREYR